MTPTLDNDDQVAGTGTSRNTILWRLKVLERLADSHTQSLSRIETKLTEYQGFIKGIAVISGAVGSLITAIMIGLAKVFFR